ncbi:hypothetical protein KI387_012735, partial [Taxus chinensis]
VTGVAEKIGTGVHFNAFVSWKDKKIKYGVIRMHELIQDVLNWDRLYISGRLQKPVHILIDNLDLENVNAANLQGATSAALLLLPPEFSEEDLFVKICGLSYMGDLRMFFAEDRHKVKKIVQGNISSFHALYKDQICHTAETGLLKLPSSFGDPGAKLVQDCSVLATRSLVSSLPPAIRSRMGAELGEKIKVNKFGREVSEVIVKTRKEAANSMQRAIKSIVRVSSLRQALSGCLAAGGVNAASYLAKKVFKSWHSRWRVYALGKECDHVLHPVVHARICILLKFCVREILIQKQGSLRFIATHPQQASCRAHLPLTKLGGFDSHIILHDFGHPSCSLLADLCSHDEVSNKRVGD